MRWNWKKIFKYLRIAAFIYVLGGALLYILQDRILFHPVSLKKDQKYDFPQAHKEINIPINDKSSINIVQFTTGDSSAKGVVLYFHGNKKNIGWYAKYAPYFTREGYEVWMIDYPGYGKSTGKLTQAILYQWAEILYRFARSRYNQEQIVIYGKSMGTGIAAYLASREPCQQLILETPYYDFPSVVKHYLPIYPVHSMIHYQIPTHQYLARTRAPITIFHGTKDRVVTYSNTERLKKFLKPTDDIFTIIGGSHNDLFEFKEMVSFLRIKLNK